MKLAMQSVLLVSLGAFVGCASAPVPNARMASSQAAIRAAAEVGAESVPSAALYLKLAEEEVAKARAFIGNGDNEEADLELQRAQADAELSLSLTRETTAQNQAKQIITQAQELRARN